MVCRSLSTGQRHAGCFSQTSPWSMSHGGPQVPMQHVAETTCRSGGGQDSRSRSYPLNKDSLKIFQTFFLFPASSECSFVED